MPAKKAGSVRLGLCKEARASLELAIDRDPTALNGSAFTSLGTLYYKVPGWPIGFGSDKKAREYLSKALDLNPTGIDPNYFMGDFLFSQGEYGHARDAIPWHRCTRRVANAPESAGHDGGTADAGRRADSDAGFEWGAARDRHADTLEPSLGARRTMRLTVRRTDHAPRSHRVALRSSAQRVQARRTTNGGDATEAEMRVYCRGP